jgi:hypothetical protein
MLNREGLAMKTCTPHWTPARSLPRASWALASLCAMVIWPLCTPLALAASDAPTPASGVILSSHESTAADLSVVPYAISTGDYFRAIGGANNASIRRVATFTVQTDAGERILVHQAPSSQLAVGSRVQITQLDGVPHLELAPATPKP